MADARHAALLGALLSSVVFSAGVKGFDPVKDVSRIADPNCIKEFDLSGDPVRPVVYEDMGPLAVEAAGGLLDLEFRYFIINRKCINSNDVGSDPEAVSDSSRISVEYKVLENSGWDKQKLLIATRAAAAVYARCGIFFDDVRVTIIRATQAYDDLQMNEYFQLVSSTRGTELPHVYFVNRQDLKKKSLRGSAFTERVANSWVRNATSFKRKTGLKYVPEAEYLHNIAMVVGNKRRVKDKSYVNRTRTLGRTIAHELYHIYGNCTCHSKNEDNFMYPGGKRNADFIDAAQCSNTRLGIRRLRGREIQRMMTVGD